jgi:hypothetical protein
VCLDPSKVCWCFEECYAPQQIMNLPISMNMRFAVQPAPEVDRCRTPPGSVSKSIAQVDALWSSLEVHALGLHVPWSGCCRCSLGTTWLGFSFEERKKSTLSSAYMLQKLLILYSASVWHQCSAWNARHLGRSLVGRSLECRALPEGYIHAACEACWTDLC